MSVAALLPLLLATAPATPASFPGWRPFLTAMPVWDCWAWLALPLCVGVAVVYKTTKCRDPRTIGREAALLSLWIVLGLAAAAAAVAVIVRMN